MTGYALDKPNLNLLGLETVLQPIARAEWRLCLGCFSFPQVSRLDLFFETEEFAISVDRKTEILRAAIELIADEEYGSLSMRALARVWQDATKRGLAAPSRVFPQVLGVDADAGSQLHRPSQIPTLVDRLPSAP